MEVIVAGVAVYRDSIEGPEYRAAGRELILVSGRFDGPQVFVPATEIDRDLTASASNGYPKSAEGIFHFFAVTKFSDGDRSKAVSIVYCMRDVDPQTDPSTNPRFFSKAFYPKIITERRRASVKVWLDLWPTDRKIETPKELTALLTGIIRVHTGPVFYKNRRSQREQLIEELQMVAALLPAEKDARDRLLRDALDKLPESLKPKLRELDINLDETLRISDDLKKSLLARESELWRAVRRARN
jgi:hypothetical protein